MESLALESSSDLTSDMEKRLDALKGIDSLKSSNIPQDYDEYSATKNLVKKVLAEAALEKKLDNDDAEEMEVEVNNKLIYY